jgi:hypothetical protein
VRQEKPLDCAVEHHDLHFIIGFERRDDLVQLRYRLRTKDVERRMIEGDAPIGRQALFEPDLTNIGRR